MWKLRYLWKYSGWDSGKTLVFLTDLLDIHIPLPFLIIPSWNVYVMIRGITAILQSENKTTLEVHGTEKKQKCSHYGVT